MDYENKIQKLEESVKKLEDGKVSLDESIDLFEKGVKITKDCLSSLKQYKGKIAIVQGEVDKLFIDEE